MKTTRGKKITGYVLSGVLLCAGVVLSAPQSARADHRQWMGATVSADGFHMLVQKLHHGVHSPRRHLKHAIKWELKRDKYLRRSDFASDHGLDRRARRFARKAERAENRRQKQAGFLEAERQGRRHRRTHGRDREPADGGCQER